jgi:hypothetical protein
MMFLKTPQPMHNKPYQPTQYQTTKLGHGQHMPIAINKYTTTMPHRLYFK